MGGFPHKPKICSFLPHPAHQIFIAPPSKQFSSYNPMKTAFLAVVIAPAPVIENNKKIILMIISVI